MKNILSRTNREILRQFAWSKVLLAFDYDGTLAPIVRDPDRARMRWATRALLEAITKLYPVVVISGRAQRDAVRRLEGANVRGVIGNHGIEPWRAASRFAEWVKRSVPILQERLASLKGVQIEGKDFTIAVHYRRSRAKKQARAAILNAVCALGDVRIIGGKQVMNLLPNGAPHKGIALERERNRLGCDTAIYVGDDETDEDVFSLDQPGQLLAIRVGPKRASASAYCVGNQAAVDDLLQVLIDLRAKSERRREAAQ